MTLEKRSDPQCELLPIPAYLKGHFKSVSNFGLYFQKFCRYHQNGLELKVQHTWDNGQRGRERIDFAWSLLDNQAAHAVVMNNAQPLLTRLHDRQSRYLEEYSGIGSGILELSATASTRLLTGIGETSPTEVGMLFDRNMGVPYLPASAIKGAVRYAYCVNFANSAQNSDRVFNGTVEERDVKGLIELFGATDSSSASRGGFSFMDAYSEEVPKLAVDIMNPHHGKYYQNGNPQGPVETELPIPIKFLVVEKGLHYKFRGFFLTKEAEAYRKELIEAFHTAMTLLGLGAKTAIGYGRFDNIEETTEHVEQKGQKRRDAEALLIKQNKERLENEKIVAEHKAALDKKKADTEALKIEMEAKQAAEAEAIEKALQGAEGIEKDILLLKKKPDMNSASSFYAKYLEKTEQLDDKQRELALLIQVEFRKLDKKAKKEKLARRDRLNRLLK